METLYKSFAVKADEAEIDGGTITGYASTFDRIPDSYGDIVAPGAFAESLAKWAERSAAIPLLYGHRTDDPAFNIGRVVDIAEDERGLKFTAEFDPDNEKAQFVRKLYKEGRIFQFSFAYAVIDCAPVELEDGITVNELRKLDIFEISCVQIPANQNAEVVDVKDAEPLEKAGRRNSKADEGELQSVLEHVAAIQSIVNGLIGDEAETPDEQGPETDAGEAEAKSEEPGVTAQANDEEPEAKAAEVDALLQQANDLLGKEGF